MGQSGMNLFEILRHHAKTIPLAVASRSSRRVVTYRKFWSRIERATARLKGEWGVRAGDTVVYWGQGHQDALMLYVAVARCGAKLLPLEHAITQRDSAQWLQQYPPILLLHDDELTFETAPRVPRVVDLSSLIATRCHHEPVVEEDAASISLLVPHASGTMSSSLQQLSAAIGKAAPDEFRIDAALFDEAILAPRVIPVLAAGGTIIFR